VSGVRQRQDHLVVTHGKSTDRSLRCCQHRNIFWRLLDENSYALTDSTTLTVQHAANSGSIKGDLTSVGAIYSLSKATNLYAHYSGASAGWSSPAYGGAAASATKGGSSFGVGIATNF